MRRLALALVCVPALAWAQAEPQPQPAPEPPPQPAPEPAVPQPVAPPVVTPASDELASEVDELYEKQKKLESLNRKQEAKIEELSRMRWLSRYINVFVDVGAFAVGGDGSGIRPDIGHIYFPQYMGKVAGQWVFMGDPLSTAINSIGEPSDTSTSREISRDTVNSEGKPSVIVNTIGLTITKYIAVDDTHGFSINTLAELLPRPSDTLLDVQYAYLGYRPLPETNLVLEAGKVDSVLGIEYRVQDAIKRKGITPSLICRYTCGRPLGVRAQWIEGAVSTSASITNGDNFQQIFEHDKPLKSNYVPTGSGHLQYKLPVGSGMELGMSGAIGPQDGQSDLGVHQWHFGFDARVLDLASFDITAEYVQGKQPGKTGDMGIECDLAPCLTYKGAYLLIDRYVAGNKLIPYVRLDWRNAVHIKGTEFVYESHTFRTTVGAQFEMTPQIIGKLEYTYNRELGGIPQFPDDVITTSLVVKTD